MSTLEDANKIEGEPVVELEDERKRLDELHTRVAVLASQFAARETLSDALFSAIGVRLDELRDGQKQQNRLAVTLMSGLILALVAGIIALS